MSKIGLKTVVFVLMVGAGVKLEKVSKKKKRGRAPNKILRFKNHLTVYINTYSKHFEELCYQLN